MVADTKDHEIILLYEQRDQQAIHQTKVAYGRLCESVAQNILGNREDAEECVSDALLNVWNAIPPAKPRNFCAYLLRLVRNHAISRYRERRSVKRGDGHLPQTLDELSDCIASRENVEAELDRRAILDAITRFLGQIPEQQRHLFVRRYWYASSVSELAEDFDMSESHVSVTLLRIRKRLRNHLEKEGLL